MALLPGGADMGYTGVEQMIYASPAIVFLGWLGHPWEVVRKEVCDDVLAKYLQRISTAIS
jgi:hypothetical protein